MKKVLNKDMTLYFENTFPYTSRLISRKRNTVTIGIGGNIGNVRRCFKKLFLCLQNDSRFTLLKTSPILQNPPFGYLEQNDFYNAIIVLKTDLSPIATLNVFQRYENRFKRTRSFQDAPRTLDIDIIFFNDISLNTKRLIIPHKGYKNRASVLIPLSFVTKH